MKIYNEITIDMNPESSTYQEVLSEEFHEYNGDIALCGSADPVRVKGDPRPGVQAIGLPGGKHPGQLRNTWTDIQGVTDAGGSEIDVKESLGSVSKSPIERRASRWHGVGSRRASQWGEEEDYSQGFRKKWYDPYTKAALETPFADIKEKGFVEATTEDTGLTQDIISMLPTGYGSTAGKHVIEKGSVTGLRQGQEDLERLKGEAEGIKEETLGAIDFEEEATTEARNKARMEEDIKRMQLAKGTVGAEEAIRAPAGTTGFAYSGPQAAYQKEQRSAGSEGSFGDIARSKMNIEKKYQTDLEGFEKRRGIAEDDYETAISGAETDYGRALGGVLSEAETSVGDLLQGARDFISQHEAFGQQLGQQVISPDGWEGYDARADIAGKVGYDAPTGGWFGDAPGFGGETGVKSYLDAQSAAMETLSGFTGKEFLGTEDMGDV